MTYKITSHDLKLALMHYYRFQYGYICAEECANADILVDTGKEIIEVEVKISKSDLIEGEKAKILKHRLYEMGKSCHYNHPNKFLFCVPEELTNDAVVWTNELNPNYGVIQFNTKEFIQCVNRNAVGWMYHNCYLTVRKSAKKLHEQYNDKTRWLISKRAVSQNVNLMTEKFFHHLRLGEI